jgi:hypothetical protein
MSNTRQFLIPINYDITKQVYSPEEIVRKRKYNINEIQTIKQYHELYTNTFVGETSACYADKLRRRTKFR